MTPLERAERAAHEALTRANVIAYLNMPQDIASVVARAVIAAIREPSEAMVEAVKPRPAHWPKPGVDAAMDAAVLTDQATAAEDWRTMIDALLEEGK